MTAPSNSPPPASFIRRLARTVASLALGLIVGVLFHYVVYRFSLPSKPFIYVAF